MPPNILYKCATCEYEEYRDDFSTFVECPDCGGWLYIVLNPTTFQEEYPEESQGEQGATRLA